jgi:hypothetical protein|tara:strand:- start:180 stop:1187 length:1008 start_codon:yes stop_codon:yes gene_type:complete
VRAVVKAANRGETIMDEVTLWMALGFLFAAYSVIANDSVQTLGTWIASNNERFNWKVMWASASAVLLYTLWYGWAMNGGDISYGRLNKIPFQEIQWYHATAPALLLILTRMGIPVSTSFLVLSAFASTFVLEKMLLKSMMGYAVAAVAAYAIWIVVSKILNEAEPVKEEHKNYWRMGQWITTGFLWFTWLSHDMANIAVFLPRQIPWDLMIMISAVFIAGLAFMFREGGGKIQKIVLEKHNTRYVRSATIIDAVYWMILWFFKELNDIPMSTTWVFVGLLCGRELAMATITGKEKFKTVFPLIGRDFFKMMIGLAASVGVVLAIHYVIVPNQIGL